MRARSNVEVLRGTAAAGQISEAVRCLRGFVFGATIALAGVVVMAGPAAAQNSPSGAQLTPDATRWLINKDVGSERWAITNNTEQLTITGNVFFAGPVAMPPQFLYCTVENTVNGIATLSCSGAPPCTQAPCLDTGWNFIGEVDVPEDFIDPDLRL